MTQGVPHTWQDYRDGARRLRRAAFYGDVQNSDPTLHAASNLFTHRGYFASDAMQIWDDDIDVWKKMELEGSMGIVRSKGRFGWKTFSTVKQEFLDPAYVEGRFDPHTGTLNSAKPQDDVDVVVLDAPVAESPVDDAVGVQPLVVQLSGTQPSKKDQVLTMLSELINDKPGDVFEVLALGLLSMESNLRQMADDSRKYRELGAKLQAAGLSVN